MIYFDNAATSGTRPYSIINSTVHCIQNLSANPGRSGHSLSIECGKMIMRTRGKLAKFFGCPFLSNVIFTKNCTEALNLAILGSVKEGGHVITTANEHNSVLRPLFELEKANVINLTVLSPNEFGVVTSDDIQKAVKPNTYLVVVNHASNVTGATCDIKAIGNMCKDNNLLFAIDTAQSAGHIKIDMTECNVDMLCFASHKGLLGIQGCGGLILSERVVLKPILFGGTGTDSDNLYQPTYTPEGFESGTLCSPAIASLSASLDYLEVHFLQHQKILNEIQTYLYSHISTLLQYNIYSVKNQCGIISLSHKTLTSTEVAEILNEKHNVAVRSGLHCAPLIHKHLNTLQTGLLRISASAFNTKQDCDKLLYALKSIK